MKTRIETLFYSFRGTICTGTLLLIACGASAQNMFVGGYGPQSIIEFPTGGGSSTFASGLNFPGKCWLLTAPVTCLKPTP